MATYAPQNPTAYELFRSAEQLFADQHFTSAATDLEQMLGHPDVTELPRSAVYDARLLLARAYFHSAQLARAEGMARSLLEDHPDDGYAALLLGRTLERRNRRDEAQTWLRCAEAFGQPVGRPT